METNAIHNGSQLVKCSEIISEGTRLGRASSQLRIAQSLSISRVEKNDDVPMCCLGGNIDLAARRRMKRDRREQIAWSYFDAALPTHLALDRCLHNLALGKVSIPAGTYVICRHCNLLRQMPKHIDPYLSGSSLPRNRESNIRFILL